MMKRLIALMMAMLMLASTLALTACGGEEESTDPAETEQTKVQEPVESTDPAEGTETTQPAVGVDLDALKAQMLADAGLTDYIDIPAANAMTTYGLDASLVVNLSAYNAMTGGAFPEEVVMVQATDEAAAQAIADQLEGRLTAIADQAASYDPDSLELAQNCDVIVDGVYVGMFFAKNYDALVAAFQAAV